jgi:hypothetical protein
MDSLLTSSFENFVGFIWPHVEQLTAPVGGPREAAFRAGVLVLDGMVFVPSVRTLAAAYRALRAAKAAAAVEMQPAATGSKRRKDPPRNVTIVEFRPGGLSAPVVNFYADECANGLGPHLRLVGLDVLTSREAGMDGEKDDRKQLLRAQCDRRILITFNNRDFRRLDGIVPHAGMLFCPQGAEFIPEIQRVCLRLAEEGVGALS